MSVGLLLSGGMDSSALAFWQRPDIGFTINYGQLCAQAEIRASKQLCDELGIKHEVVAVDCRKLGAGDLAGKPTSSFAPASEWWPFRNQLLITLAAMRAISLEVDTLQFGAVQSDSFHTDGRREFFALMSNVLLFQEGQIRVVVPAIDMTTTELIKISGISLTILAWAHSCHTSNFACGNCRGCAKHRNVMGELGEQPY